MVRITIDSNELLDLIGNKQAIVDYIVKYDWLQSVIKEYSAEEILDLLDFDDITEYYLSIKDELRYG